MQRTSKGGLVLACALVACAGGPSVAQAPASRNETARFGAAFTSQWADGQAELAGYALTYPRYGALRRGTAVMITVTEPFRHAPRVKAEQVGGERFGVLKLNLVQDFQTGVYDYNLMTSAFIATEAVGKRPAGLPTKVSFSAQEWCGHVYAQATFEDTGARLESHSYFEQEADQRQWLSGPASGASEDGLLLWARGLAQPWVARGESARAPLLRSLELSRLQHVPPSWDTVELSRDATLQEVTTSAGTFQVERASARVKRALDTRGSSPDADWTFFVEADGARRIVKWTRDDGLAAELVGQTRLPYWKLHDEGGERHLQALGLQVRAARTP